jgi:CheY-like chemotaxis protein
MPHALIIDDDPGSLEVMAQLLQDEGITSTAVSKSTTVEGMIDTLKRIDIIFLDLEMPGLDGYQLFARIKDHPGLDSVPIIACTVHTNEVQNIRDRGFNGMISKPLNVDTFGEQVHTILGGTEIWRVTY